MSYHQDALVTDIRQYLGQLLPFAIGRKRPRLCKNVFQCDSYSKPDWKPRFYAKSTYADVPINFRFIVEAHTLILATRFYTLWARSRPSLSYVHTDDRLDKFFECIVLRVLQDALNRFESLCSNFVQTHPCTVVPLLMPLNPFI